MRLCIVYPVYRNIVLVALSAYIHDIVTLYTPIHLLYALHAEPRYIYVIGVVYAHAALDVLPLIAKNHALNLTYGHPERLLAHEHIHFI